MDSFCGSKFWDWSLTWNTDHPQFTPCFEETVLVWIPCAFLLVFSGVDIYLCLRSNAKEIPWGWLNISKVIGIFVLLILTFLDITYAYVWHPSNLPMYAVDYSTGIIKHVAFLLAKILVILHKKRGVRTSGTLFFFWFFLVLGAVPHYVSVISSVLHNKNHVRIYPYISNVIYFPTALFLLILEFFVDGPPKFTKFPPVKNLPPNTRSSFICNLFCCWFDSYALRFFKKPLQLTDLWNLSYENRLEYLIPLFYKYWNVRVEKVERKSFRKSKLYRERSIKANGYQKCTIPFEQLNQAPKKISIVPILWNSFYCTYLATTGLKLMSDILMFVSPQILSLLISFEESDEPMWRGFLYMFALVCNGVIQTTFINNYAYGMFKLGLKLRSTIMAIIFRKALKISNGVRKTFTIGDITNLMSVDSQRFYDLNLYLNMAVSAPITIILALYFLWRLIGFSAFAGLAFMIILIPINTIAANKVKELQSLQMKSKDERVKVTTEVLSGIKTLKIYAWESSFEEKILKIRSEEVRMLMKIAYLNTAVSFVWTTAPYLVSLFTFAVFVLSSNENILTADIAFVSLSLFNIMKLPISLIPRMLTNLVQTWVATKRINEFLNADEIDQLAVTHNKMEPYPLLVENGKFNWDIEDENPSLSNINLRVETGSLVAVVGPVGSGKSSLLSALLGEMNKLEGRVNTKGSIAYVTQQAWLQNATLRDNILFLKPYQKSLYNKVVDSCALTPDFQILPAGDFTEIGDKGVNLSGGQKQRINLARSVYNNADVYLLDDPLSAVDAHVGKHIFENVIGPKGMLRKKTRILVTHAITFLSETDLIIVMKDGMIADSGSYYELLDKQGAFADFISTYSFEELSSVSEEPGNLEVSNPVKPSNPINRTYERRLSDEEPFSLLSNEEAVQLDEEPSNEHAGERLIQEETVEEGKIKLSVYLYYIKAGGISLWLAALTFNIVYQALNVISNLWLTAWSTDTSAYGTTPQQTTRKYYYLEIYALLGLGQVFSAILASLTMYLATTYASDFMHQKLLEKVLKWPAYMFDITPVGRIINRLSFDVDVIDNVFPFNLRQLFILGGTVVSTLYVISYSSPYFIVLIIPIALVYILFQQIYVSVQRQLKRFEAVSRTPVYSLFSETITGAPVIRAYEMQNSFIVESEDRIYRNQLCTFPSIEAQRWIGLRLDLTGTIIIFFAAFFAVLERGVVNAGVLSLSVTYALQITGSLNWVIRTISDIETNVVSVERIKEFEKTEEENWDSTKHKKTSLSWPQKGEIVFDDFKVRYREGLDLVLRGLSLKIRSEEKVGIVGRTGAGKSSLTLSLFRIVEAAGGKILIDGVDISTVDLKTLRSRVSVIPQDPVLFSGTIRFNLDPFFEYSDQELWHALELAHLKSFIRTLSKGLDFQISENGDNISIGQRQLVCLARALLRKTKILILDEATAAIDLETDDLIQKTIRKEFKNCTVLTIAHKLNTVMDSDRILVLDNGMVKEFDSPQKLLTIKDSIFYGMAKDAGLVA